MDVCPYKDLRGSSSNPTLHPRLGWGNGEVGEGGGMNMEQGHEVGSEATVRSVWDFRDDVRCLLLCVCNIGELCDECPLKG
ncbi:hypothetical protein NQZ68_010559 [Dissostichus eleginoides]|nr:hypothetical protein NQZ68_010559 [Dissostichus eleginoides]